MPLKSLFHTEIVAEFIMKMPLLNEILKYIFKRLKMVWNEKLGLHEVWGSTVVVDTK
jgi:hypothetical protein